MRGFPKFTKEDADVAFDSWGANCGPGALAAIAGKTLDEVRIAIPRFDSKHYTSPTMMYDALNNLGVKWSKIKGCGKFRPPFPTYGLVRVQWEGPWTDPGVPPRVAYRYTHWIGAQRGRNSIGVFDINCMNNGTGWVNLEDWKTSVVPYLVKLYPKADGGWHITHSLEVAVGKVAGEAAKTAVGVP